MASSPLLLVVAIDLGTTHSDFAYSFLSDFQNNPLNVFKQNFVIGNTQASKVPTSVLFTPDRQFHSFGAEAEKEYARLCDEDRKEARKWYYFKRFKTKLNKNPTLSRDTMLVDQTQKKGMLATEVFSAAVRYLKDQFTAVLRRTNTQISETEITWVLTIPANWDEKAWSFARVSAEMAGIAGAQLTLVLESEAASMFCLHYYRSVTGDMFLSQPRKRFLLVNCGGETFDISVFETDEDQRLKSLHLSKGIDAGDTMVDKAYEAFLGDLLGFEGTSALDAKELLQLRCAFEEAKHRDLTSDRVVIEIPKSVQDAFLIYASESEKYSKRVRVINNMLMLDKDIFLSFFQKSVESITKSIDEVLKSEGLGRVDAILLAGGIGESDVIQTAVRKAFPRDLVLVAPTRSAAVLTGAVIYSFNRNGITDKSFEGAISSGPPLLVAAIDFGTTYSGFAFSFHSDFQANPVQVYGQGTVTGGVQVSKVPTSVLFTPDRQFHSFGAEAEREYARLCDEDRKDAARWYYFEHFKMKLYKNPTLSRDTMLMDQTQKKGMLATEVFSAALRYLKDQFTAALAAKNTKVKKTDIKWLLTIPAIWEEKARQFMREVAGKAGIPGDQLTLVLEPEAASVFCLHHYRSLPGALSLSQPRTRFLVADCGGGTIDISVFETDANRRLKHLHKPKGTDAGGRMVDKAFEAFLSDLLGFQGITAFEAMEMLQLRCAFEEAKRLDTFPNRVAIEIPGSVEMAFSTYASESEKYNKKVSVVKNKLMLDKDIFLSFFQKSAKSITESIDEVLKNKRVGHIDAILLAGGFSESDVIQTAVREAFPRDLVLVAPSPSAAVLTGAVMYGHDPVIITARVSAFTYGISVSGLFREGVHDEKKSYIDEDGEKRCRDVFDVFMKAGDEIPVHPVLPPKMYFPPSSSSTSVNINIYKTSSKTPTYVTEAGCEQIGSFIVLMPDLTGGRKRQIKVTVEVGGTELKVTAEDGNTGEKFSASCDFLSKHEDDC